MVIMMTSLNIPWKEMEASSKRRVSGVSDHDVHWITDANGRYGIYIQSTVLFSSEKKTITLNGIEVIKRNSKSESGEWILLLNQVEDAPIFLRLCEDLISTVELYEVNDDIHAAVQIRLQRWQELLKRKQNYGMSIEIQMGLFAELSFLEQELFSQVGVDSAIKAWVGPDADKQDFILQQAVVEVKSYRTSKGTEVSISSGQQLYCEKQPLFLATYGLTPTDKGQSVEDIVQNIKEVLARKSKFLVDEFSLKLIDYGFIPELESEPYAHFIIDTLRFFQINDSFPRLIPPNIPLQITRVKYSVDLMLCGDFEVDLNSIFIKE